MARSIAIDRPVNPRSLRARRIAAFSTPSMDVPGDGPRLRRLVDQRCLDLGVTLTEAWRDLARIFDETDAPLSASEVWSRARGSKLKASRSHIYLLIRNLLALGVLIVAETGPPIRYATPLAIRMTLRTREGQDPLPIEDPLAIEALVAALLRAGQRLQGHDIEIALVNQATEEQGGG